MIRFRNRIFCRLSVVLLVWALLAVPARAQFTQQGSKLVGTGAIGTAGQGFSVALSGDGNTAIVGGPFDNNFGNIIVGAAWVYTRSGAVWSQQAKLVGTGVAGSAGALQGNSVSLSDDGNTAIVGGPFDNNFAGAAWVFTRSGGVWSQQAKLVGTGVAGPSARRKARLYRFPMTGIPLSRVALLTPTVSVRRGCSRAWVGCGASKRNWSAVTP